MTRAVEFMPPLSQVDSEVVDPCLVSQSVFDFYDMDLHGEDVWDWLDIPLSDEIAFDSSLMADFPVIHDECVVYSFDTQTKGGVVFKLTLCRLCFARNL